MFPINAAPEVLPFAQNVLASDASRTPTVSWTLPDLTGFDVDRVRLRVLDEDLAGTIVYQADLASDATSYVMPSGVLEINHRYTYVVPGRKAEIAIQINGLHIQSIYEVLTF